MTEKEAYSIISRNEDEEEERGEGPGTIESLASYLPETLAPIILQHGQIMTYN